MAVLPLRRFGDQPAQGRVYDAQHDWQQNSGDVYYFAALGQHYYHEAQGDQQPGQSVEQHVFEQFDPLWGADVDPDHVLRLLRPAHRQFYVVVLVEVVAFHVRSLPRLADEIAAASLRLDLAD